MKQLTPAVLLCSSVNFCVPEPTQEGGDGQVPWPTSRTPMSVRCSQLSHTFLTQVQPNHSAPLFPPCLVKCGIILFSFLASVKALMVVDHSPRHHCSGVSGSSGVSASPHTCNSKLIYVCDSLGRRKSFKQVGPGFKMFGTGLKKSLVWETGLVASLHPPLGLVAVVAKG